MSNRIIKSQHNRVNECIEILKKITDDLNIDRNNPSVQILKKRMLKYWHDGTPQNGRIPLLGSNRSFLYSFPKWEHEIVEITLRTGPIHFQRLPSGLEEELLEQMNNAPKSDP